MANKGMKVLAFVLFSFSISDVATPSLAQQPVMVKYGEMISETKLKDMLTVIASDSMEGRKTGTRGQQMAAAFIKNHFKSLGLSAPVKGDYYQKVKLYRSLAGDTYLRIGDRKYSNMDKVLYYGNADSEGEVSASLVFAGLGREEDFNLVDVKNKAVLIRIDDGRLYGLPEVTRAREKGAKMIFIWNTDSEVDFNSFVEQARYYEENAKVSLKKPTNRTPNSGHFILSPSIVESVMSMSVDALKKRPKRIPLKKSDPSASAIKLKWYWT